MKKRIISILVCFGIILSLNQISFAESNIYDHSTGQAMDAEAATELSVSAINKSVNVNVSGKTVSLSAERYTDGTIYVACYGSRGELTSVKACTPSVGNITVDADNKAVNAKVMWFKDMQPNCNAGAIQLKQQYNVTYYVNNNDNYLKSINIVNPNPAYYTTEDGLELEDLHVDGYNFIGWFTAQTGGTQVTSIAPGTTGNKTLYAHWEKMEFTIQFACDMVPQSPISYTTDSGAVLPKPQLDKYTFVGWSDEEGNIWDSIPKGTAGNMTLYANWASNRNKAEAVKTLGDPIVCEDSENGLILFSYEIGTIKNVPLYTTLQLQCANGLISTFKVEEQDTISETNAKTVAEKISQATTNSSSWTLSSDWNKTTEVSQSYLDQTGQTREEAESEARSSTGTYSVASSTGGKKSVTNSSTGSFNLSANFGHSGTHTTEHATELKTGSKTTTELGGGINAGLPALDPSGSTLGFDINGKIGTETGWEQTDSSKDIRSGTNSWGASVDAGIEKSNSKSAEATWNSSSSYSNSSTVSKNKTVSNAVSRLVSEQYGYGESYAEGGSNSQSQALATTDTNEQECSSAITYFNSKITTKTTSFSSTGNTHGNYRMVMAGTVHVFAVVCYDVAKQEYFVYTYNVLGDGSKGDDAPQEYLDYSWDGSFDDYETSIIPFEIPYYVDQYVNTRVAISEGLQIDPDTGMVVDYFADENDPDTIIYIPSYFRVDNNDGTFSTVKITGIQPGIFKNNTDIVGVSLSRFIEEIPESAFEGCTSLKEVICPGVTKINDNAFKGCTSLSEFVLAEDTESVGYSAFEGAPSVKAIAATATVAQEIAGCGADSITLDISAIPEDESENMEFNIGEISSFELQGKNKEYKGLSVRSDAEKTVINGVTFTENDRIPMEFSSGNVTLDRVTVDCTGFALVLKAAETKLLLNRSINMISDGSNAVLCKEVNISPLSSSIVGKLNVTGNVLVCGNISGNRYLTVNNGEIINISEEEYENYLSAHRVSFDANGGTVNTDNKLVAPDSAFGELPVASRDYYRFDGWYTEPYGGEEVTSESIMTALSDITLYAHWTHNEAVWALVSNVPEGAEIVDRKYKYTLTLYTTSGSSQLSGWTPHGDPSWVWSDYGAWSGWQDSYVDGSDSREVKTQEVPASYDLRGYTYANSSGTRYYFRDPVSGYTLRMGPYTMTVTPDQLNSLSQYGQGAWYGYASNVQGCIGGPGTAYVGAITDWVPRFIVNTNYKTQWSYRDRSRVYTYYYTKTESKESASYPMGDNISNIEEYVQYRTK